MKKYLLSAFAILFVSSFAFAQKGEISASIGADVALPLGNFGKATSIGIGGTAKGLYGISDQGDITLTVGYIKFGEKDNSGVSWGMVPIMPGYRHTFDGFYLEPQLGLVNTKVKSKLLEELGGLFGTGAFNTSSTNFSYALGGGIMMGKLDLGLRFQGVSSAGSANFVAARVGYTLFSK